MYQEFALLNKVFNMGSPRCMEFLCYILLDLVLHSLFLIRCGDMWWDLWYDLGEVIITGGSVGAISCPLFNAFCYVCFLRYILCQILIYVYFIIKHVQCCHSILICMLELILG